MTWTIINGVIYLVCFAMIGWMLLDAMKVAKK
ncbi:hypothetical protein SAMN04515625_1951 [Methanohalophilus halophilus]|jgi:hypothetical protein|uniref:Uncharacterized protein n=3 Tax=Methanohalophilus TaxID=2175 RepID=D5EBU1_METMS|nr:hypothetical protein Mmah_1135 [Methanohalophilus mahii DSM 5219]SDW96159.1 hypothetical protein SAMN04515625_1951 [Methanohalophilus halophilus]SMH42985.1 hypothetical protein SAMN06264941_1886 [Methanohalophilus portucalensis FDF-1]